MAIGWRKRGTYLPWKGVTVNGMFTQTEGNFIAVPLFFLRTFCIIEEVHPPAPGCRRVLVVPVRLPQSEEGP